MTHTNISSTAVSVWENL